MRLRLTRRFTFSLNWHSPDKFNPLQLKTATLPRKSFIFRSFFFPRTLSAKLWLCLSARLDPQDDFIVVSSGNVQNLLSVSNKCHGWLLWGVQRPITPKEAVKSNCSGNIWNVKKGRLLSVMSNAKDMWVFCCMGLKGHLLAKCLLILFFLFPTRSPFS